MASLGNGWRAIAVLVVVGALGVAPASAGAQAGVVSVPPTSEPLPGGSQFQGGDGDQANRPAAPGVAGLIDWQGFQAGGRVEHIDDPQHNDDIFGGGKELEPEGWELDTKDGGSTPGSGNILDTYRAFEHPVDGDAFLYLAFTRYDSGGTIYVTFELNQDHVCRIQGEPCGTWRNATGTVIPCRRTGDLLISFTQSGNTAQVQLARWTTTAPDPHGTGCAARGTLTPATNLTPPPALNANVQASFNYTSAIPNFLPGFFGCPAAPGTCTIPVEQFGETAINLSSALSSLPGADPCAVFGSTWMHSRTSLSDTASLKDYVGPHPFRVRTCKATPALTTQASGIVTGRAHGRHRLRRHRVLSQSLTIHDTATLEGGDKPTGTLTFRLYGPGDEHCQNPIFTDPHTVNGAGGFFQSGSFEPDHIGTYRWVVEYTGDDFNEGASTKCGEDSETITIERAHPTLTSTASGPTHLSRIDVGSRRGPRFRLARVHTARATEPVSDAAHLAGGFNPTGTLTFKLFGPRDPTCSGTPISTTTRVVDGNGTYYSEPFTPTRAGTYRWVVSYSGDPNNHPASTECGDPDETIVVGRAQPTIATIASPQETQVGNPITDTALLSGGAHPRGRITFRLYGPGDDDCSGPPVHTSSVHVRGNRTYESSPFTPTERGIYRWIAIYSGDRNNTGVATDCSDPGEHVRVGPPPPVQPTLTTTALPAEATAGSLIRDVAHLTGADPTGSITFQLFGPGDDTCSTPIFLASRRVSGNADYTSRAFRVRAVGTYRWVAVYSGDEGNKETATACADPAEAVTVTAAQPRIRTVAQHFGLVGHTVRDVAFLSGASRPTGTITFRLYGPDNPTCSGDPVYAIDQNVVGRNGFYPSPSFRAVVAGTYLWTATFTPGDANNLAVATTCGDANETTVVLPRRPRLTTSASPPAYVRSGRRARAAGRQIYDSARLTGTFRGTGEIRFDLYGPDDPNCTGPAIFTAFTEVNGNNNYNSAPFTATVSGTYRWRATYSGDVPNNRPAGPTRCDDPAEHVQVTIPARPGLTTSASQAVTLGGAIHDIAYLSGGADPTGTITFRLYGPNDTGCSGPAVFTSTVPVAGNVPHTSASFVPTTAGAYRWVARYSGDPRNHAAGTACSDPGEAVIVRPPTITPVVPAFSTTAAQLPAGGATLYDTALLSGGIDPTGAITFELFGPDDATCSRPPVFVTTVPVMGNGAYPSAAFAAPAPGTYRWVVTYSGDAMNSGVGPTACGDSTETIAVSADPTPLPNPGGNASTSGRPKGAQQHRPRPPRPVVTG